MQTKSISIIIPTYNERPNVRLLVQELFAVVGAHSDLRAELIIVDDNSPDGTAQEALELQRNYPVRVIQRTGERGLGVSVMEGIEAARYPLVAVMDGDLSHDPSVLPEMIEACTNADIVVASRMEPGGTVDNWRLLRKTLSLCGIYLCRGLTKASDPLSGYFVCRKSVLKPLAGRLVSSGYKILLEILVRGCYSRIDSVPFLFRQRAYSKSKLCSREYFLFLKQIIYFYKFKIIHRRSRNVSIRASGSKQI